MGSRIPGLSLRATKARLTARPPQVTKGKQRAWDRRAVYFAEAMERRVHLAAHIVGSSTVYSTIQAAVDAAAPNSVLTVDAGVYSELVIVGKPLTIRGAQA